MEFRHVEIQCNSRSDIFGFYPVGDTHIGARNCAEGHIKHLVAKIKASPNAYWIGGGDYINAIKPQDIRWDTDSLADWILKGDAETTRARLRDVCKQEADRFTEMVEPIKDKCLGLIEGNHETTVDHRYNQGIQHKMCETLGVPDLTDEAFLRIAFKRGKSTRVVLLYIQHGYGGGRSAGAEPNKLYQMCADKRADILLRGHSHTFHILPPIPELSVPVGGKLPVECTCYYKRAANWGCWLRSHARGRPTYDSRAQYPSRPLSTLEILIEPHIDDGERRAKISMRELN